MSKRNENLDFGSSSSDTRTIPPPDLYNSQDGLGQDEDVPPKPCSLWNPTCSRNLDVIVKYLLFFDIIFQSIKLGFTFLVLIIKEGPQTKNIAVVLYFGLILNILCLATSSTFFLWRTYWPWPFDKRIRTEKHNFIVCITWVVVRGIKCIYLIMSAGIYFSESTNPKFEDSPQFQAHLIFGGILSLLFVFEALWFIWIMVAFILYEKRNPKVDNIICLRFTIINRSSDSLKITPLPSTQVSKSNMPKPQAPTADPENPMINDFRRKLSVGGQK